MIQNFDEVQKLTKNNIDAMTKAFEHVSKSAQAIATVIADHSKRTFENGTKAIEKLLGAKSLDKAIEVQSEYVKAVFEDYTAQATKLGELYANLAQESFKPWQVAKKSPVN